MKQWGFCFSHFQIWNTDQGCPNCVRTFKEWYKKDEKILKARGDWQKKPIGERK